MKRTIFPCLVALLLACAQAAMGQSGATDGGDPREAAKDLTQEQLHSVDDLTVLYNLATIYQDSLDMKRLSWTLEQMSRRLPLNGEIRLALAAAYSNLGDKAKAYDTLLRMQQQGFGFNLTNDPRFEKVSDTEVWTYAVANLRANLKPFGDGRTSFALPRGEYLFESIAWDPKRQQFLVGSAREGKIFLADKQGQLTDFISPDAGNGLWGVYAIAADPQRDALWVASTSSPLFSHFKAEDIGKAGVFKFQLSTGKLLDKVVLSGNVSENHTLTAITVSSKGQVFAIDGIRNIIYRVDGKTLKPFMQHPDMVSLRGMTTTPDGNTLYFADYQRGIFGVDLATGKPFDVGYDLSTLVLPGIEALHWYDGTLIAVEPGMNPPRIMRLHLSRDGRSIERFMPIDAANPALPMPTGGTVVGNELYLFADSRRDYYDQYGVARNDHAAAPQSIFRSDLRFAWEETMKRPLAGETPKGSTQHILGQQPAGDPRKLLGKDVGNFGRVGEIPKAKEPPKVPEPKED